MAIALNHIKKFLDEVKRRVNSNSELVKKGKGWNANVVFDIRGDANCPWPLKVFIEIENGKIKDISFPDRIDPTALRFELTWSVFLGIAKENIQLGIGALRSGKIKLHGHISSVLRRYGYLKEVIKIIQDIIKEYGGKAVILLSRAEFIAPHVIIGKDVRHVLAGLSAKKALIVTDQNMVKLGFAKKVEDLLLSRGIKVWTFDRVIPEPPIELVEEGARFARKIKPDVIIGLGGGSAMDAAKAILLKYTYPKVPLDRVDPSWDFNLHAKTKLILIPTTSGTGSEATWAAVISTKVNGKKQKLGLGHREFIADLAIIDPHFVRDLPPNIVSSTGLDALVHAVESLLSPWVNEVVTAVALRAIKLISRHIEASYKGDQNARAPMHYAATLAGMAFANSQATLCHGLGHAFGATFGIPHGWAVAVFLPVVLKYYSGTEPFNNAIREIAETLGVENNPEAVINTIVDIIKRAGGKTRIREFSIPREEYESKVEWLVRLAKEDACTYSGPRLPTDEEIKKLFLEAY